MQRTRTGRAIAVAIAVSALVMVASAAPASAMTKKIDVTLTSAAGCHYHIEGTISFGPLTTTGFVGTVTVTGDGPACNGIIVFDQNDLSSRTTGRLTAGLDTSDLRSLSKVRWQGSNRTATSFLNADMTNSVVCNAIRNAVNGA